MCARVQLLPHGMTAFGPSKAIVYNMAVFHCTQYETILREFSVYFPCATDRHFPIVRTYFSPCISWAPHVPNGILKGLTRAWKTMGFEESRKRAYSSTFSNWPRFLLSVLPLFPHFSFSSFLIRFRTRGYKYYNKNRKKNGDNDTVYKYK